MKIRSTARARENVLELSNLRMHELPEGFRDFGCITELNLSFNWLVSSVFATLATTCTSITKLDLSNNFLSGPLPPEVAALTALTEFVANGAFTSPVQARS